MAFYFYLEALVSSDAIDAALVDGVNCKIAKGGSGDEYDDCSREQLAQLDEVAAAHVAPLRWQMLYASTRTRLFADVFSAVAASDDAKQCFEALFNGNLAFRSKLYEILENLIYKSRFEWKAEQEKQKQKKVKKRAARCHDNTNDTKDNDDDASNDETAADEESVEDESHLSMSRRRRISKACFAALELILFAKRFALNLNAAFRVRQTVNSYDFLLNILLRNNACVQFEVKMRVLLLKDVLDVNAVAMETGDSALMCAIQRADQADVKKFTDFYFQRAANLNHRNLRGETILHCVARRQHASSELFDELIGRGAKPFIRSVAGESPIAALKYDSGHPRPLSNARSLLRAGMPLTIGDMRALAPADSFSHIDDALAVKAGAMYLLYAKRIFVFTKLMQQSTLNNFLIISLLAYHTHRDLFDKFLPKFNTERESRILLDLLPMRAFEKGLLPFGRRLLSLVAHNVVFFRTSNNFGAGFDFCSAVRARDQSAPIDRFEDALWRIVCEGELRQRQRVHLDHVLIAKMKKFYGK